MTIDLASRKVLSRVDLYDPTPAAIKRGRTHLYDTHASSGLGQVSCATCHVDARMDRLAWDLGDPNGSMLRPSTNYHVVGGGSKPRPFHPMKGAMITSTLQDIIGHEPFHWRGDRAGIEEFNSTFTNLLGADSELTAQEMSDFKEFLKSVYFPPNPYWLLGNPGENARTNLPLPGFIAQGKGNLPKGAPLPNGNSVRGTGPPGDCFSCHIGPSGLGQDPLFATGQNENHSIEAFFLESSEGLAFKVPQFRNLYERMGLRYDSKDSTAGFGFLHDGRADRLERFVQDGAFAALHLTNDQTIADISAALLLTWSLDTLSRPQAIVSPTRGAGRDSGKQAFLRVESLGALLLNAKVASAPELVLYGSVGGLRRTWLFQKNTGAFQSNRRRETMSSDELMEVLRENNSFVLLSAEPGTGSRLALDRDQDGYYDQDEIDRGSDPADADSIPSGVLASLRVARIGNEIELMFDFATPFQPIRLETATNLARQVWSDAGIFGTNLLRLPLEEGASSRYYRFRREN